MRTVISMQDFASTVPLTILVAFALAVLIVESLKTHAGQLTCWLSLAGLIIAGVASVATLGNVGNAYAGMVTTGGYANYFAMVFCTAGVLSVMLSQAYIRKQEMEQGEYYVLILLAVAGMMLMAAAADLVVFFLGLELMSVCFYVLAGFFRKRSPSNEAALKYFLLGAFATGFLLYGISLLYGASGTTNIGRLVAEAPTLTSSPLFLIGLGLLLVGLAFKVAAVPFHMWVPDVYEGAPTTVSAFMSTGGKAAAFSVILLIFAPRLVGVVNPVRGILATLAMLSMVFGNIVAIAQTNVKRMLAYSSIAHAGYILVGIVAANTTGGNGVLFYLLAYTAMNVGAFGVISIVESKDGQNLSFDDYAGLSTRKPVLALLMALFMFSLSGIPPFAGFFGKYYVFAGAIEAGYTWLAVVGVLMSAVSAYYYLRLVVLMYFKEQASIVDVPVTSLAMVALLICAIGLVGLGVHPSLVLNLTANFF